MEKHPLPQNVSSYEFRLVGEMTLKQFAYLAGAGILALLVYAAKITWIIKWPLIIGLSSLGAALAFIPINDQPLSKWIGIFIKSIFTPTQFVWQKKNQVPDFLKPTVGKPVITPTQFNANQTAGKFKEFVSTLPAKQVSEVEKNEEERVNKITELFTNPNAQISDVYAKSSSTPTVYPAFRPIDKQQTVEASKVSNISKAVPAPAVQVAPPVVLPQTPPVSFSPVFPPNRQPVTPPPPIISPNYSNQLAQRTVLPENLPFDRASKNARTRPSGPVPYQPRVEPKAPISIDQFVPRPFYSGRGPHPYGWVKPPEPPKPPPRITFYEKLNIPRPPRESYNRGGKPTVNLNVAPTPPTQPNVLVGQVFDSAGNALEGVILEIRNTQHLPVRALKSNKIGQFRTVTPLPDGWYELIMEKAGLDFDIIRIEAKGQIILPIEIKPKN